MKKTVFVSSTYEDLAEHRRAIWQVLEGFAVAVRGMEQFGARTEAPLETCLAEVEQGDVYVGIVAFRLGSIHADSGKSFTQLEYEHALNLKKDILIYLIDEDIARVRYRDIDLEPSHREKIEAFKRTLRERHTVDTFSSPEDLAEKLRRDFARHFSPRKPEANQPAAEFEATLETARRFLLMPKSVNGREVRLRVSFVGEPFPASRDLCKAFNLNYGFTIGIGIKISSPAGTEMSKFKQLFASGDRVTALLDLLSQKGEKDLYARLQFVQDDVHRLRAVFFGYTAYVEPPDPGEEDYEYVPPQGQVILLFSKPAS